jgi:hypothetical protein
MLVVRNHITAGVIDAIACSLAAPVHVAGSWDNDAASSSA